MTKEALKLALEALEDNHEEIVHNWALFDKNKNAIYAIKKALSQTEQEPVAWMSEDEREAFERFNETCEDGEEYDVPKTMMKRLAEIGVIHHTSRGIYGITKFGHFLVGKTTPPQRKPLLDEFGYWWFEYGSGLFPLEGEDQEEHAYRVATAAWQAAHGIKGD